MSKDQGVKQQAEFAKAPVKLINEILTYLGTRPYQEVATLVTGVHQQVHFIPNEEVPDVKEAKK